MELDNQLHHMQKWYSPICEKDSIAFGYLGELIKRTLAAEEGGVPFCRVVDVLKKGGVTDDMVDSFGFSSIGQCLFHLDDLLEVRCLTMDDHTHHFVFVRNKCQKRDAGSGGGRSEVSGLDHAQVSHDATFPVSFGRILSLYRGFVPIAVIASVESQQDGDLISPPVEPQEIQPTFITSTVPEADASETVQKMSRIWTNAIGRKNKADNNGVKANYANVRGNMHNDFNYRQHYNFRGQRTSNNCENHRKKYNHFQPSSDGQQCNNRRLCNYSERQNHHDGSNYSVRQNHHDSSNYSSNNRCNRGNFPTDSQFNNCCNNRNCQNKCKSNNSEFHWSYQRRNYNNHNKRKDDYNTTGNVDQNKYCNCNNCQDQSYNSMCRNPNANPNAYYAVEKVRRSTVDNTRIARQDLNRVPGIGHFPRERRRNPRNLVDSYEAAGPHGTMYVVNSRLRKRNTWE